MNMLGDLTGRTLLVFPRNTAARVAEMMLRRPDGSCTELGPLERSAIMEAGNILSGAHMNALSDFMGIMLLPSPPSLVIDMSRAVRPRISSSAMIRTTCSASRPSSTYGTTSACAASSSCCLTPRH
jgi:chemotaxis protein CheY-P-specific phosphatase CheC